MNEQIKDADIRIDTKGFTSLQESDIRVSLRTVIDASMNREYNDQEMNKIFEKMSEQLSELLQAKALKPVYVIVGTYFASTLPETNGFFKANCKKFTVIGYSV